MLDLEVFSLLTNIYITNKIDDSKSKRRSFYWMYVAGFLDHVL